MVGHPAHATQVLSTGLSSPCLCPLEFLDHPTGEDTGFSQGAAGMCRCVWSQARHPLQSHQGVPTMHGPVDDPQWQWCYGSLPVKACRGGIRTFSTPEEETTLLGEEDELSGAPGPAPLQGEISRFIEPAKQTTTPVTSTVPHSCLSLKREESWKGIDINLNNSGQWVYTYLERDNWLPEWWEGFCPLVHSTYWCCNDAQAKNMACQQAVAFDPPATQKKVHIASITPNLPSSAEKKGELWAQRPQMTWDYWEVQREETIMLAIVLQLCTILARTSHGKGPLPPTGSEIYWNVHAKHFLLGTTGMLPKGQGTLSDYNALLPHGNTCPKHWPESIPTLLMKWTLDQVNTHSPNKANFRIKIPLLIKENL